MKNFWILLAVLFSLVSINLAAQSRDQQDTQLSKQVTQSEIIANTQDAESELAAIAADEEEKLEEVDEIAAPIEPPLIKKDLKNLVAQKPIRQKGDVQERGRESAKGDKELREPQRY